MAKRDDIQVRLIQLAVATVRICDQLPDTRTGGLLASQLLRSGTAPAPNYAEARGAESDKDFVHKLKVVLKELNETFVWLEVIREGTILPDSALATPREECTVLCRIVAASINTVRCRMAQEKAGRGRSGPATGRVQWRMEAGESRTADSVASTEPEMQRPGIGRV